MKIKFNSDGNLPLKKTIELYNMITVVRSVFHEDTKYYLRFFFRWMFMQIINIRIWWDWCVWRIWCWQNQWLARVYHLSLLVLFEINFRFQPKVCDGSLDLMQKAISFHDVAIVFVTRNDWNIHFLYMSKKEAVNLLRNADLAEKSGKLQNIKSFTT